MEGNAAITGRARGISTDSGSKPACTLRFKVLNNAEVYPGICNIAHQPERGGPGRGEMKTPEKASGPPGVSGYADPFSRRRLRDHGLVRDVPGKGLPDIARSTDR